MIGQRSILARATSSQIGLLFALFLFVFTRSLTLTTFPIFNDEAIYLRYAQSIHDDWGRNKFISMDGEFTDWKPPLQYWIAAPVIQWGGDPLVAGRLVSLLLSFLGLFGFFFFTRELFSQREGVIATMLYVLCPPVLFHNNQFTAETFLFSIAPFFYWALLKVMRVRQGKVFWGSAAVLLGTALLLIKQSAALLLVLGIALPLAQLSNIQEPAERISNNGLRRRDSSRNWKSFFANLSVLIAIIICSHFISHLMLPAEFNATKEQFNRHWVMSVPEIVRLPINIWYANLRVVEEYIDAYYSWSVGVFFCVFLWFAFRDKDLAGLSLALMCVAGGGAIAFLLRGFNEYLFNTAIIVALLPLLARTVLLAWTLDSGGGEGLLRAAILALATIMVSFWGYQIALMRVSPGKYLERSTRWAAANYLNGWSTGFGVKEVVALLEKENEPGVIFTDTQWGNPTTALEVYAKGHFPNLRLVPVSREFLDRSETRKLRDAAKKMGQSHYAIFSADESDDREKWIRNIESEMCENRTEVRAYPGQMPIIVCQF